MTRKMVCLLAFCLLLPGLAFAALPDQIDADFAAVSGVLVMPVGEEYIVDLDARNNLQVGDILTLVKPGQKIFHPVTKEVLGTVDEPVGYLQVTRIFSGYSYAKLLTPGLDPAAGSPVKRFEQVPAVVAGKATEDEILVGQLKMDLPQFDWLSASQAEDALVIFNLQPGRLEVKNAEGNLLRSYTVTDAMQLAVPATSPRPSSVVRHKPKKKLMQRVADNLMETIGLDNDPGKAGPAGSPDLFIRQQDAVQAGVWLGPNLSGQPVGIVVADLDGDDRLETVVALEDRLLIARIENGEFQQVAEIPFALGLQMLSLDALDLDGNGQAELYLSAVKGFSPASLVVEFRNGSYQIVADGIRWFLRAVELPGQQGRWLVGQRMSELAPFAGDIFHVRREGDQLISGGTVDLPDRLNIFNFVPLRGEQGQLLYVYLSAGDYLIVLSADGKTLWESEDYFGGSELCFTHREEYRDEMLSPTCMRPRIMRTTDNEIIVAQNEGQRILERYRKFNKSRLVALQWNGFALVEQWRSASQSGYLGDFTLADADNDGGQELVMAIKFKHAGLVDKARSAVVTYDLE